MFDIDITCFVESENSTIIKPTTIKELREIRVFDLNGKKVDSLTDDDFASFVCHDECSYTFIGSVAIFAVRGSDISNVIFYRPEI